MSTFRMGIIAGVLILTGSLGFAFGYLMAREDVPTPIIIEKCAE